MKVHKYEFRDEDILIDGAVPEAKVYVLEADALAYARSEREAGAKQEREEIIRYLRSELSRRTKREKTWTGGSELSTIYFIESRSRGAKVCTCGGRPYTKDHPEWAHADYCPCYEPPKKVCTCGSGSSGRAHGLRLGEREIGNLEGNMTLIKEHGGVYGQIRMTEGWMDAIDDLLHDWRALAPKERGKG